jgi:hypothetical protein
MGLSMANDFLRPIKEMSWADVFSLWRDGESHLTRWIDHYRNSGFASWDAWRTNTLRDLHYQGLNWTLFELIDPPLHVPDFIGGPFRPWIARYYQGAKSRTFREIVTSPALRGNPIVREMEANFPKETYIVGLQTGPKITVIEGMHRCCALALAAENNAKIDAKVFIALAPYSGELPEMGRATSPT